MSTAQRAIDCLVNVDMGKLKPPEWMVRVKEDTFRADDSMFRSRELPELLEEMADKTGGEFFLVSDRAALEQSFHQILDALEKTDIEDAGRMYTELFPAFVGPALIFLVIELFVLVWLRRWP